VTSGHRSTTIRRRHQIWSLALVASLAAIGLAIVRTDQPTTREVRTSSGDRTSSPRRASSGVIHEVTTTTNPDDESAVPFDSAITDYLDGRSGDITAALYNLTTGTLSEFRPDTLEYTASIVKVDILATLLQQSQLQGVPLPDSEQDLSTTMIEQSNDDSADDLWNDIGQQNGLAAFNSLIPLPDSTPGTDGHWGGTETTAADQVGLLRQLVQPSQILDSASQSYELGLMEHIDPSQAWGITAGVPSGVTVGLKNGWLSLEDDGDWQVNSIGWVDGDGPDYLLAVLTKNNDTEAYGIDTIEGLSRLVWKSLTTE
jgi:hypothetical protein